MIKGKNIYIRTVRKTDLNSLYSLSFDFQDAGEFMPVGLQSETAFNQQFAENGFWQDHAGKLIVEDDNGRIVGEVGCFKAAHYIDGREIYYRIFSGARGKGYASEALNLLLKLLFESSSFNRLQAVTVSGNQISEHMLKKAGFTFEGTLRQARYFKGKLVDLNQFSLLRSEWQD
ncbi:GNAT family N-acetyltransferase [Neptunicella marina]|uniref:GNAT family N-acetyltransferase n=1 Tax=Neptunicella marina TaxID=2125989 RepID=A0A8J6M0H0_9ALTE|nr:GNAT family N-acetyltransferase [Neptunicella marina]